MPIYEYECGGCGHRLEAIQKVADAPLSECPTCGKPELKRLISAAGFQLKGSGWYATDFKNSGRKPAAKPGGEDKTTAGGESSGSDAKDAKDAKDGKADKSSGGARGCAS